MDLARYARQTVFRRIGPEGQRKLLESRIAVIGLGALGSVIAGSLCRSGVGFIRLIDRDTVELSNLQRQTIFDERDAREQKPKAVAAFEHLSAVNSEITLEPVVADVNSSNVEELIKDVHLVLDGSDNAEVRHLVNEACHKLGIPWIYGGVLGSLGTTMNILYGDRPCFRCFSPQIPAPGSYPTCSTVGVLNMTTGIIGCVESAEALKILVGSPDVRKNLFIVDVWDSTAEFFEVDRNADCPVCGQKRYELLGRASGAYDKPASIDFERMAAKLGTAGTVSYSRFMLSFDDGAHSFHLFPDGRAIIKNVKDERSARSVYAEYIGI